MTEPTGEDDIATESQDDRDKAEWEADCKRWRGKVLTGFYAHWCCEWDGLPIDETCIEWPCCSFEPTGLTDEQKAHAREVSKQAHDEFERLDPHV